MRSGIELSVVTTLYKSQSFLDQFIVELYASLSEIACDSFEIILVNDGSPDQSLQQALELQKAHEEIVVLNLSRNFGHHAALKAGIEFSSGDWIYLSDCDLEISPKELSTFFNAIKGRNDIDMVYGVQDQRRGSLFTRLSGKIFWKIMNMVSDIKLPKNMLTERIFNRKIADALSQMGDHHLFLGGMLHWIGFRSKQVILQKQRRAGKSTYTVTKRINLMINAISSFSGKPLLWLFYLGLSLSALSFLSALIIVIIKLLLGDAIQLGWSSLIVLGIFAFGVISTFQGIIGIYLHKMFQQVQNRPQYIISSIHRS